MDWESAAIGAGEIDLASLTDGWPTRDCANPASGSTPLRAGPRALRPSSPSGLRWRDFTWGLRWLGNTPDAFPTLKMMRRIEALEPLARRKEAVAR